MRQDPQARHCGDDREADIKPSPGHSRCSALFTGEGEGNADTIDVSRLHTWSSLGLLLGSYLIVLIEYVRTVDATGILLVSLTGAPVFASMPPVDVTFVGLLASSHAGYLAFKATHAQTPAAQQPGA